MQKYDLKHPSIEPEVILPPPLHEDDAILVIQANERGRQGRVRAAMLNDNKIQQQYEAKLRRQQRELMTPEHAATLINSAVRSFLVRKAVKVESEEELKFLGMTMMTRQSNGTITGDGTYFGSSRSEKLTEDEERSRKGAAGIGDKQQEKLHTSASGRLAGDDSSDMAASAGAAGVHSSIRGAAGLGRPS